MSSQQPTIPLFDYEQAMLKELNKESFGNLIDMFKKTCYDYKERTAYTVMGQRPAMAMNSLRAFCREQVTAYKVPRYIEFQKELPKSNVGKILRRELRD